LVEDCESWLNDFGKRRLLDDFENYSLAVVTGSSLQQPDLADFVSLQVYR